MVVEDQDQRFGVFATITDRALCTDCKDAGQHTALWPEICRTSHFLSPTEEIIATDTTHDDNATTWRDLADQLIAAQIAELE
jgi:hypothetical protein